MSVKAVAAVLDARGLKPAERVILIILADTADDAGYSWRSLATVADLAELDQRHVRRLCLDLVVRGLLDRTYEGGGRSRPALYRVLPTVLLDDHDSASRLRYELRFGLDGNGVNMSPIDNSKRGSPRAERGVPARAKGGSTDPPNLQEPSRTGGALVDNAAEFDPELIPRLHDEPIKVYLERSFRIRNETEEPELLDEAATND